MTDQLSQDQYSMETSSLLFEFYKLLLLISKVNVHPFLLRLLNWMFCSHSFCQIASSRETNFREINCRESEDHVPAKSNKKSKY